MRYSRIALLLCLLLPMAAPAQSADSVPAMDIEIVAEVDRSTINLGDLVDYTVTIKWNDTYQVDPPGAAANLEPFIIRDFGATEISKEGDRNVLGLTYKITTYDVGQYEIPPFRLNYTAPDGTEKVLRTERIGITVLSLDPAVDSDPKDIKPPAEVKTPLAAYLRWGTLALLALALAGVLAYWFYRYRHAPTESMEAEQVPAHELALERLALLENEPLETRHDRKAFVFELSEILREYLERRYDFGALEMTTDELLSRIPIVMDDKWSEDLSSRILLWDLVKFAKYDAGADDLRSDLGFVKEMVEDTAAEPEPEEPQETDREDENETDEPEAALPDDASDDDPENRGAEEVSP